MKSLTRDLLVELLKNYSPTFRENKAIQALKSFAERRLNFDEVWIDSVGNLIARYGDGNRRIAFVGHIDTVEGYIPVKAEGDVIKGRGAVDAKGPLASAFVGASIARDSIKESEITVYAIALVGEEGPSHGAWNLVREGKRFDHVVICEPSNTNNVVIEYRGSALMKVTCRSEPMHTASINSEDACTKAIDSWLRVKGLYNSSRAPLLTLVKLTCGEAFNVTPQNSLMYISSRIPSNYSVEKVVGDVRNCLSPGCDLTLESSIEPVRVSLNKSVVRALVRSLIRLGLRPRISRKLGTSDMNVLYGRVTDDIVAYGPGRSELSHTNKEKISLDELATGARVYGEVIKELLEITKLREP